MASYDDIMAEITRQQYDDYINRFLPVENQLIDLATSDELLNDQLERNIETVDQQYATAGKSGEMQAGRMGLDNSKTQQQTTNTGLSKSLSLASAQNETRAGIDALQKSIITGVGGAAAESTKNQQGLA
ncbi:hypothetical protein VPAG_00065 [Vibrio phage douglas 12A4]|uniref:hypothetical protein n=1 Tax=Vibrio phage douglas 12A4 TaxID=573171 RepID=UPI0002C128CD|nr:hypothetical protein VPAG_00065 [Vibrio phage douglas 12A4]AGG58101.1 hypothetical protein VPAG_00065 [Vibrio phage douglas 12A4]